MVHPLGRNGHLEINVIAACSRQTACACHVEHEIKRRTVLACGLGDQRRTTVRTVRGPVAGQEQMEHWSQSQTFERPIGRVIAKRSARSVPNSGR